jgi:hypothetical protein
MKLLLAAQLLAGMLAVVSFVGSPLPARADETTKPAPLPIEGGVKGTAVNFDQGISYIDSASMNIERAAELVIRDATRQDMVVLRGPNVLPNGTVIPQIGGVSPMGQMPIHKNKVAGWVAASEQNLQMLQSYLDGLIIPPEKARSVEQAYTELRGVVDFASLHMQRLKDLLAEKDLSNQKIAREAFFVHDAMEDIRKRCAAISGVINGGATVPPERDSANVVTTHHRVTTTSDGSTSSGVAHSNSSTSTTTTTTEENR